MNARRGPKTPPPPPGLLVVDKPAGWTSHDVVGKARRLVGTRKVGHAGTLDPMATGVLVLGVERATKLLGHLALDTKTYLATIRLGAETSTDDAEGEPTGGADASGVTDAAVAAGVAALTGDIAQVPSTVSAIKVDGRRAYERARAGEEVVLEARPVHVARFDVLATRREGSTVDLDVLVDCSSGTYVRALARDLGRGLGVGGHLTALRRTRVGPFTLAHARDLDTLAAQAEGEQGRAELSLDLDAAVDTAFPRREVDAAGADDLAHGRPLPAGGTTGTTAVFGPDGHVVGLVADERGWARPVLVLAPAG
ncbi:tRNA pseudouridine(55) synthase TruB [Actinomycetospora sp. TBRC 11914]|uniref:tRNA pseudouridine(55) synthase TruB n=1 Tax=Actinomycetospora sp. TBRC 11914 TaxID=2729387 RepID=UPI00145C8319|nr:tRNA pseudouridine(55) synthase TruB [Actinomycetospora sp. TBRC 11914]NMO89933.1 tRNA pseudouridine(55) synthase TruB [Actinomycetospora sp. TBRC 11914]